MSSYNVGPLLHAGHLADVYECNLPDGLGVYKKVKDSADNGRLVSEMMMLSIVRDVREGNEKYFFPKPVEHFLDGAEGVNVLDRLDGFISLEQVLQHYPDGMDPRDMAWIFRRMLYVLVLIHEAELIYNNVQPQHILIHPIKHGLILVDWTEAQMSTAEDDRYRDVQEMAKLGVWMLGGDRVDVHRPMPDAVPFRMKVCLRTMATILYGGAATQLGMFDDTLARLWGQRKYRRLALP